MRDNPGHVAAFGDDPERRRRSLQRMFSALFRVMRTHERICAVNGDTITGVAAIAAPGTCRPTAWQKTRMASLLAPLGARRLARVLAWQGVWREHDPEQPHSHFGPLAVDAHLQGRGIGSRLMREYTRRLDAAGQLGYLETDKPENVVFYERHGFVVTGEAPVLGNPNWFMRREPRHP
jgi:GNAT superfamily N-acetyltransferase